MEILAFAKVNLSLEVLGRRDDGYHRIRTILQTIDLADRLDIRPHPTLRVECDDATLNGEANLVWQAAVALASSRNILPKASIAIHKSIPVGMGLGGGSSAAAAALIALDQLWDLSTSATELAQVAAGLGSDVPFFLRGGTALAEGRGERIKPLQPLPSLPVLLVCPDITIPGKTGRLYSNLTPTHYSDGTITHRVEQILERREFVEPVGYNVFEEVACSAFPGLGQLRRRIEASIRGSVHLTGSGPALFSMPSSEDEYRRVVKALQPDGVKAYLVHTITPNPSGRQIGHHQDANHG